MINAEYTDAGIVPTVEKSDQKQALAAGHCHTVDPPYKRTARNFYIAVLVQLLLLTGMGAVRAFTITTGREIVINTMPVDPWDMFRGDYVRLGYQMNRPEGVYDLKEGKEVWAVMEKSPNEQTWHLVRTSLSKPGLTNNQVAMRGSVQEPWIWGGKQVHYGIEQYYVPEGTGKRLERAASLRVRLAVDTFGNAAIKEVSPPR